MEEKMLSDNLYQCRCIYHTVPKWISVIEVLYITCVSTFFSRSVQWPGRSSAICGTVTETAPTCRWHGDRLYETDAGSYGNSGNAVRCLAAKPGGSTVWCWWHWEPHSNRANTGQAFLTKITDLMLLGPPALILKTLSKECNGRTILWIQHISTPCIALTTVVPSDLDAEDRKIIPNGPLSPVCAHIVWNKWIVLCWLLSGTRTGLYHRRIVTYCERLPRLEDKHDLVIVILLCRKWDRVLAAIYTTHKKLRMWNILNFFV